MSRRSLHTLSVLLALGLSACGNGGQPLATDIQLLASEAVRDRITDLSFSSELLKDVVHVRVMTPADYDPSGKTRYPVVYLLHGAGADGYRAWTEGQEADGAQAGLQDLLASGTKTSETEAITASLPVIFVMPDSGPNGGYINWYNGGAFGPPAWESFHLGALLPWIDAHYPTIARREGRAVAGFSMGGYGAMHYAARRPDLFVAVAGFSPAVDKTDPLVIVNGSRSDLLTALLGDGEAAQGSLLNNMVYIRGHNPMDLASNLAGMAITVRTGTGAAGLPSPLGPGGNRPDPVEAGVFEQALRFSNHLNELGIAHVWAATPGAHSRSFAELKLQATLPWLMQVFANPPALPESVSYRSIDTHYEVFGWTVDIERPAREFSELRNASRKGFELSGSGKAWVTSPALFDPGERTEAVLSGDESTQSLAVQADSRGRIRIPVDLGPGNPHDEFSTQAQLLGSSVKAVAVSLLK
ncbi:MAG: alpha/beta hydrolase family protein [Stagnimonas sp.]|nr:alpha/beta hydrolase family protein [Stagnimonas sp.]